MIGDVVAEISVPLDGFVAGPRPTLDEPLGEGGEQLHEWVIELASWRERHGLSGGATGPVDDAATKRLARTGAVVMGRRMFSGGRGPWEQDSKADGWWGDDPPFRVPVIVLTHHARDPLPKRGGTTFAFVTDGVERAVERAREAAGDADVAVAGGASGDGTRLLERVDPSIRLERTRVLESPNVTHLRYRARD